MPATTPAARSVLPIMPVTDAELEHIAQVAAAARRMGNARALLDAYDVHSAKRRAVLEAELAVAITKFLEARNAARVAP